MKLNHRDNTCPMYNTCSSLGYISEECSIKCYHDTVQQEKKDKLLQLYREYRKGVIIFLARKDRTNMINSAFNIELIEIELIEGVLK